MTMTAVAGLLLVTFSVGAVYGNSTSSSVTKTVGQDVTLTCGIQDLATYHTWVKEVIVDHGEDTSVSSRSRSLRLSTRNRIENSSLLLTNLTLYDSGYYICSVLGQGNHTITLTVIQPKESWKQALVGFGVTILSLLPGVLCIMIIVCYGKDFRRKDKSGDRTACWICACLGWSFLLFIASAVATWFYLTRSDELFPRYIVFLCVLELLTVSTQIVIMILYKIQVAKGNRQHIQTVNSEARENLCGESQS